MAISQDANMLHGPVVKTFFRYSLPWTLSFLFMSSAGIVDGIFVGQYIGSFALAALNIIWPLYSLLMGINIALAAGGAVRCAAYLAKGQDLAAQGIFTKCLCSMFVFSLFVIIPCTFYPADVAAMLGADASIMQYAVTYLRTAAFFFPSLLLAFTLSYFLRVDERPNLAAFGLILTAFINMLLDYIFIAHWNMGVHGAALATGMSYSAALFVYILGYFLSPKKRRLYLVRNAGKWNEIGKAMWNGISEMINEMSTGTVIIVINITIMQILGARGVAAFTVINYINWFCLVLSFGLSDSLSPLVSANHACKLHRRSYAFFKTACSSVFCIGFFCFLIMSFFPELLVELFLPKDDDSTELALEFMNYSRFMFLFCGINIVLTAYFTGLMQAANSAIIAILRTLIFPIPLIIILSKSLYFKGIALALPLSEALTLILGSYIFLKVQAAILRHKPYKKNL